MRDDTPIGFNMMSTGVPSGKNGMSSSGKITLITPLFPCLPAILSPTDIFLVCATQTRTILFTPGATDLFSDFSITLTDIIFPL